MKKILFLGDSNETLELLQQAKLNNLYTIVTDYYPVERSASKLYADEYWMVSTNELDVLVQMCLENEVSAVISGVSDYNIEMSIRLCDRLNLPVCCSLKTWYDTKNKVNFKEKCKNTGVCVPRDYYISEEVTDEETGSISFPVVVKPSDREGNAGVFFCYEKETLAKAHKYAKSVSVSGQVIVEQMIEGTEFFAYYLMAAGDASFLTLGVRLSQPGEPNYCYSVNTTINNFTEEYLEKMDSVVVKMLKEIGCMDGVVCLQCMIDEKRNFYAFEMCYSPEGSTLITPLRNVCSFDVIQWQLECALGVKHTKNDFPKITARWKRCANSYILFTNKAGKISEISGLDIVEKMPNVMIHMHKHEGDLVEKYSPLGNIMFDTDDCEQLCNIIERINNIISIKNTSGENILIYYNDFESLRMLYRKRLN